MGVPSFYRWLTNRYPGIVFNVVEEKGEKIDASSPNPNGLEFDNLYLDMNGIIHPCFHPDDPLNPPTTFQDVFNNIYEYIDRLFCIVRPRKLLFMAIDGVAPRAKMNQQRSRRFKTAKDNDIAEEAEKKFRREFEMKGKQVFPKVESEVSDSNIITPGTQFMSELSKALQYYINERLKKNAGWKDIKVILSDANVPGEGEHKIMSFIRLQRNSPYYNPNTHHCLYGLDADLIMLALATHEVHFSILREDVLVQEEQSICESAIETGLCQSESSLIRSRGWFKHAQMVNRTASLIKKPYQFLHVWILREYLELDFKISDPPENIKIDLERIIDDFIFICFFTGNDFLPHLPTLEIHEGAIDLLIHVYTREFKKFGGYLTDMQLVGDNNKVHYVESKRVQKFILMIGTYEEKIFKKRSELRERRVRRLQSEYLSTEEDEDINANFDLETRNYYRDPANGNCSTSKNAEKSDIVENTQELKGKLKSYLHKRADLLKTGSFGVDKVKLGTIGWKERYYKEKFSAETSQDIESTRKAIVQKYTEGLCWVLQYYFSGVPSWTWFYPYQYGPFASDLKGLAQVNVKFQKGLPFKPFDQLMGVLPPRSAHALPKAYRTLMTSEQSKIIDFYPTDFEVDTDGKRYMWQCTARLPFINEERLLSETKKLGDELEEEERMRNKYKLDKLFVRSSNKLGSLVLELHQKELSGKQAGRINNLGGGISGFISPCNEFLSMFNHPCSWKDRNETNDDIVLCALYEFPESSPHVPRPLEGVHFPEKAITEDDIVEAVLWHENQSNSKPSYRFQVHEKYRKDTDYKESSSANSSSWFSSKAAGSGWAGRGKECGVTAEFRGRNEYTRRAPLRQGGRVPSSCASSPRELKFPSSHWDARTQGGHPVMSSHGPNFSSVTYKTYNSNENWRAVGFGRGEPKGFQALKIAESSADFKSYGRGQAVNNNFRSSIPWRQSVQSTSAARGQGWDKWQKGSAENAGRGRQFNESSAATTSMQGRGIGQYVPKTSATKWIPRDSSSKGYGHP